MKKHFGLVLLGLLLGACTSPNSSSNSLPSTDESSSLPSVSRPSEDSQTSITGPDSAGESVDTTPINVCDSNYKPGGINVDGSTRMAIPCNKNDKVAIGQDNATMTSFDFESSLPTDFRHIYGTNFTGPSFYAPSSGGGLKMDQPRKGIQTPMFVTNLKLEVRLNIGSVNNNSHGNEIDKAKPVMTVLAFNENGIYVRKYEIATIDKTNENTSKSFYIDGTNVAYLEIRLTQYAYKGSQGYNFALKGIDMIAWPYPL